MAKQKTPQNVTDADIDAARRSWEIFTKSSKWAVILISISVLLLGLTLTDLF